MSLGFWKTIAGVAVVCSLAVGCEDGGGDGGDSERNVIKAPEVKTISGTWRGTATIDGVSGDFSATLELSQNGNEVTGVADGEYAVSGTFDGTNLNLIFAPFKESGAKWTGTYTGTFDGNYIVNLRLTMKGSMDGRKIKVTGSCPRLYRSKNFAEVPAEVSRSICDRAVSAAVSGN